VLFGQERTRLLTEYSKLTGTIHAKSLGGKNEQVLDKLKVERERGITGSELFMNVYKKTETV